MKEKNTMFLHWNATTRLCYKQGMKCNDCPNKEICNIEPWNLNPWGIKNIKYAVMRTLGNIGEPDKLKVCDCKKHIEFDHTIDKELPFGNVESIAIFKCSVCGKEFTEDEVCIL